MVSWSSCQNNLIRAALENNSSSALTKEQCCHLAVIWCTYNGDVRGRRLFGLAEPAVDPVWHTSCEAQKFLKPHWDIISGKQVQWWDWWGKSVGFETCLEPPELLVDPVWCSFSNSSLFLDTSSNSSRVLWVTSGNRTTSDFSNTRSKQN